ncbi:transposase domain-containing protein [Streptomyces sp. NPDC004232]|uniref:transposase domain-containing protein n=1 Tax=Streptomyces sp. NPDC004232 TaxID=3154454 RepID=UPI0033BCCD32
MTVAAGVFAPGHLGELTKYLPFELVDVVLAETGAVQRRLRSLPSRVGVYFVLALGLFPHLGYAKVWDKLVVGLTGLTVPAPSEKALRDLRRHLGTAPVKALFEIVAGPLAQPRTPGVRYRRWRTVAFDGCSSITVPDAERNRGRFGRPRNRYGWTGYPLLRLMVTLLEEAAFHDRPFHIGAVYVHSASPIGAETVVRSLSHWKYHVRRAAAQ